MNQLVTHPVAFADGETLFSAGEAVGRGYVVLQGRVAMYGRDGQIAFVGHPGDVIGELSVLLDRPQDLTAVAEGAVRALPIARGDIERAIEADPASARLLARQMLNALQLAPAAAHAAPSDMVAPDAWKSIRIRPDSPEMVEQIAREGVDVPFLPFNIGRATHHGERHARTTIHLMLHDEVPYNISRHHMTIEAGRDAIILRDVGSHLGTVVNGTKIGIEQPDNVARLRPGDNIVWAGGASTPFRFILTVEV